MTTVESETEWIASVAPDVAARFLARLSWEVTFVGRDSYEAGTDELTKPRQLRKINELQHRITACLSQLLEGKCPDGFLESIARMVLTERDDELEHILQGTWIEAKKYIQSPCRIGLVAHGSSCDGRPLLALNNTWPTSDNSDISPVGWYLATYQLRFVELAQTGNDDPERRFITWENTILVKASGIDEAYDKAVTFGLENTSPYKGGPAGVDVQWVFEGILDLLPIYEELADGSEVAWGEYTRALKTIRRRAISKDEARQNSTRSRD
jgi:hypothetical protein